MDCKLCSVCGSYLPPRWPSVNAVSHAQLKLILEVFACVNGPTAPLLFMSNNNIIIIVLYPIKMYNLVAFTLSTTTKSCQSEDRKKDKYACIDTQAFHTQLPTVWLHTDTHTLHTQEYQTANTSAENSHRIIYHLTFQNAQDPGGGETFLFFYLTLSTLMQSPFQKDYLDRWGRGLKTDNALTGLCWRWRKCSAVCVAALGVQCVMNWGIVTLIKNCKVPCMSISGSDLNQKFWCHFHSKCAVYLPCFDLSLLGSSL